MQKSIFRNKKAQVQRGLGGGIFLVVALFAIAIVWIFAFVMFDNINTELQKNSLVTGDASAIGNSLIGKFVSIFDNSFLFVVIGLGFAVIAGAFFTQSHPALFYITIPILAFFIWMGALYANIYEEITNHQLIIEGASQFVFMGFIFNNYVIVVTVFVIILAVALFGKQRVQVQP